MQCQAELQSPRMNLQLDSPACIRVDREFLFRLGTTPIGKSVNAVDEPPRARVLVNEYGLPRFDLNEYAIRAPRTRAHRS